jgi:anaerobic selenocysteine-containing dehydrogenase
VGRRQPFHHHQDLSRLRRAWRRPEIIIVHEPWWTATARHADIVLPATTSLERNDLGGAPRDRFVIAMHKAIEPVGNARADFDIFRDLSRRLGCGGRDEALWLRHLYGIFRERAQSNLVPEDFSSCPRKWLSENRIKQAVIPGRPTGPGPETMNTVFANYFKGLCSWLRGSRGLCPRPGMTRFFNFLTDSKAGIQGECLERGPWTPFCARVIWYWCRTSIRFGKKAGSKSRRERKNTCCSPSSAAIPKTAPLRTPSGRIELYSDEIARFAYDDCPPHPAWVEPAECGLAAADDCVSAAPCLQPTAHRLRSQMDAGPVSARGKIAGRETLAINPVDARSRGIGDGESRARFERARGLLRRRIRDRGRARRCGSALLRRPVRPRGRRGRTGLCHGNAVEIGDPRGSTAGCRALLHGPCG